MLSRLRQAEDLSPDSSPRGLPTASSSPSGDERWADIAVDPATGYDAFEVTQEIEVAAGGKALQQQLQKPEDWLLQDDSSIIEEKQGIKVALAGVGENSVGSRYHDAGRCKPCAFFHTKGCNSGSSCLFCHRCPAHEKQRRKRLRRQLCHSLISSFESRSYKGEGRPSHPSKAGHSRHPSDTASTCSGWGDSDGQFHHSRQGSTSTQTTSVYESGEAGNMANLSYALPPPAQLASLPPASPMAHAPPMAPALAAPNCVQAGAPPDAPMLGVYTNSQPQMMSPHGTMPQVMPMMTVPPSTQMEVMPMNEYEQPILAAETMPMMEAISSCNPDDYSRRTGDGTQLPGATRQPLQPTTHLVHGMSHSPHPNQAMPQLHGVPGGRPVPAALNLSVEGQSPYMQVPVSPTGAPVGYVTCGSYQYALVPVQSPYPSSPAGYATVGSPHGYHEGPHQQVIATGHEQRWMPHPGYHHGTSPAQASPVHCAPVSDHWW